MFHKTTFAMIAVAIILAACSQATPTPAPIPPEQLREVIGSYCGFTGEKSVSIAADDKLFVVNRWETWYFTPLEDPNPKDIFEAALCKIGFSTVIAQDPEGAEGDWDVGVSPEVGVTVIILGHYYWVEDPGSDNILFQGDTAKLFLRENGFRWLVDYGLESQTSLKRFGIDRLTGEVIPLP